MSTTNADSEPEEEESTSEVQTGSLVTESLPHNYEPEALSFEIEEFRLDGEPLQERGDLHKDDRYLTLVDETGWDTLEVEGTVELQLETIKEVFPPNEWDEPPGKLAVVKTDRLAIHRSRTILAESPVEETVEPFEISIERDEHRGTVRLEPFLTRASDRDPGAANHAFKAGSRLANGVPWIVQLDEKTDGGGLLVPVIEDFEDNDRFPNENHIHYLSLRDPQNPQLYLNRGHPRVVKVLKNTGATGGPPRLRDVLYDYIEHSVWVQLLIQTARDTDPDTGETDHDWQDDVLDIFLDDLYPDLDEEQAAIELATDVRNVEDLPSLVQDLEHAVHQQYDLPTDTTNLIEEAIQSDD